MVFVTNPWEGKIHDSKTIMLINDLHKLGYNVKSDKTHLHYHEHNNLSEMMYDIINQAEKVLVVIPESLKDRIDSLTDGLGNEYRNIISGIYENSNKYILLVFTADSLRITQNELNGREIININPDTSIANRYTNLLKSLFH